MTRGDGIIARIEAVCHKILHPFHKLIWKLDPISDDPEFKCEGDIVCQTCNVIFWCRFYDDPDRFNNKKINDPITKHKH